MTEPTQAGQPQQQYTYSTDQQASVNSMFEVSVNGETVRVQVTNRYGSSADKIVKTVIAHIEALSALREVYPKPATVTAPAPATTAAPKQNATGTTLVIKKMKVVPEVKDGKPRIMVELYADGHQWADIKAYYNDAAAASAAFAMVTGADFSTAGEYAVEFAADYRNSEKLNSKGNPYKNLVSAHPLD